MRILFMGSPKIAAEILETLLQSNHQIIGLVCQEDKKAGRNLQIKMPATKELLLQHSTSYNIPIFQPQDPSNEIETFRELKPDLILVVAYGKLLGTEILHLAPCVNIHASLLPKYRGASPIQSAILENNLKNGITAMLMNEGLDCGAVLGYCVVDFTNLGSEGAFMQCTKAAKWLSLSILEKWQNLNPIEQRDCESSSCGKITKEMGCIAFRDAQEIVRKSLAYEGWPGVFLENGVKIYKLSLIDATHSYKEGEILAINKESVIVGCLKGSLSIGSMCVPGKKEISAFDFVKGKRLQIGNTLF